LINLLQSVLEVVCFHHPVVWWLSRRIRTEREHVADDLAVRGLLKDSADPGHAPEARRCLALALDALDDALRRASNPEPNLSRLALAAHGGTLLPRIARLLNPTLTAPPVWGPGLLATLLIPCAALALRAATEAPVPIGVPSVLVAQIDALALKEDIDRDLLRAVAWAESRYRPEAKSAKGALGLLQVMPETAQKFGAQDLADPAQVAAAGARYLKALLVRYPGDVAKAVAAYNAGEAALDAGRITEEATRYQALVLALAGQRVIQPAAPQENGEVEGVLWTPDLSGAKGANTALTIKMRMQGNMKVELIPEDKHLDRGEVSVGAKTSAATGNGTFAFSDKVQTEREPWSDAAPRLLVTAYPLGTSVIIRAKTANETYVGEARVTLDAPLKTFKFRMVPKP
jgi:hypothetical protein